MYSAPLRHYFPALFYTLHLFHHCIIDAEGLFLIPRWLMGLLLKRWQSTRYATSGNTRTLPIGNKKTNKRNTKKQKTRNKQREREIEKNPPRLEPYSHCRHTLPYSILLAISLINKTYSTKQNELN